MFVFATVYPKQLEQRSRGPGAAASYWCYFKARPPHPVSSRQCRLIIRQEQCQTLCFPCYMSSLPFRDVVSVTLIRFTSNFSSLSLKFHYLFHLCCHIHLHVLHRKFILYHIIQINNQAFPSTPSYSVTRPNSIIYGTRRFTRLPNNHYPEPNQHNFSY